MTDTPWTPGPWVVSDWDDSTLGVGPGSAQAPLAYLAWEDGPDARLIAAAPEMAELLTRYASGPGAYPAMLDDATALLTRIRGES